MKKIKISVIIPPDQTSPYIENKNYCLVLDGTRLHFSSHKKAVNYLSGINRKLNQKLHEINQVYCMTFQEYRNKWFYLDPIQTERINSRIAYIENTLTKVVVQKYSINFNYYVYSDLSKIIQSLQEIITVLQECSYDDKTYTEVYRLTFLKDLLNQITEEISIK